MFAVCGDIVLDGEYMQFKIICSLSCSNIVNTFDVDPHQGSPLKSIRKTISECQQKLANMYIPP